jgi:hypothetical protein
LHNNLYRVKTDPTKKHFRSNSRLRLLLFPPHPEAHKLAVCRVGQVQTLRRRTCHAERVQQGSRPPLTEDRRMGQRGQSFRQGIRSMSRPIAGSQALRTTAQGRTRGKFSSLPRPGNLGRRQDGAASSSGVGTEPRATCTTLMSLA